MKNRYVLFLILVTAVFIGACTTNNSSPQAPPSTAPADVDTPIPQTETEEAIVTEVMTETEEAIAEIISVCPDNTYYIAVSYALDETSSDSSGLRVLAEGESWIVVTATLANQGGETVEIGADDLALIDADGSRYPPEVSDETMQPQLVGSILAEGESVLGFARFAIKDAATPTLLEWSPGEDCGLPIQSSIP